MKELKEIIAWGEQYKEIIYHGEINIDLIEFDSIWDY